METEGAIEEIEGANLTEKVTENDIYSELYNVRQKGVLN